MEDIIVIQHLAKIIIGYKKFTDLQEAERFVKKARENYIEYADSSFYILDLNKLKELGDE